MSWDLYVTDRVGTCAAAVDPYESAEIYGRVNDVSTWQVTLPTDTEAGQLFITDSFARLEVVLDAEVWRSGPVTHLERTVDIDGDSLQVSGADDTVWLQRRNAHPQPGTAAPPYSTSAYDVHTGPMSQVLAELVNVNAGPGAVPARQVPGLTVPIPAPAGPTLTVSARWQNLLTLMQDTARPEGLIFDVRDLAFEVYLPSDPGVVFSAGLETLAGWKLTTEAAKANKVVVAGQGTDAARLIREQIDAGSGAQWGLAETFQDRRDTPDVAELDKAGIETLASSVTPVTVVFTPLDTDGQTFGRDWSLGDLVTVNAGGLTVHDQVREVHVTLDDQGATVIPSVGRPLATSNSSARSPVSTALRQLERI